MRLYKIVETPLEACFEILPNRVQDDRGKFIKIFHEESFTELGLINHFEEEYVSESKKGILRGLHFQTPPYAHVKVVTCLLGIILDVVVDLRKESPTYGRYNALELNAENNNMLYVPEGFAHGFYVISEHAIFLSMNSKKFSGDNESGIKWDSFGFDWPNKQPFLSEKDKNLIEFEKFTSPF